MRDGEVPALFIPHGLSVEAQLALVLRQFQLPLREPRCMACGGELAEVSKEQVEDRVPPRTYARQEHFYACRRCGRVWWQGNHWQRIAERLRRVSGGRQ